MTLIVLHSLKHLTSEKKARLLEILQIKTDDAELINEALLLIEDTESIKFAQKYLQNEYLELVDIVDKILPDNEFKQ